MSRPAVGLFVGLIFVSVSAAADPEPIFALNIAMAPDETGAPVRSEEWLYDRVDLAERIFSPLLVHVHVWHWRSLDKDLARIEDPKERDRFAPLVVSGEINVFVVQSLRDNEVRDLYRMGVTWDSHTTPSRRFIILSADSVRSSLAHELGHFLGIQPHSNVKNNLMGYDREDDKVFLDASQQSLVIAKSRALRESGSLVTFGWMFLNRTR